MKIPNLTPQLFVITTHSLGFFPPSSYQVRLNEKEEHIGPEISCIIAMYDQSK